MSLPPWDKLDERVKRDSCIDGTDEFKALETWVNKSSEEEIASQVQFASISLGFLVSFGSKKSLYRKKVVQVVGKLADVPKWVAVYRSQSELHDLVDSLQHEDLRHAFGNMLGGSEVSPKAVSAVPAGAIVGESWPEWEPLPQIIQRGSYEDAGDEFNAIKLKVSHSTNDEIGHQIAHAEEAWTFLFGVAAKKKAFRNIVKSIIERFKEAPGWMEVFNGNVELQQLASNLHDDLKNTLSISVERDEVKPEVQTIGEKMDEILAGKEGLPTSSEVQGSDPQVPEMSQKPIELTAGEKDMLPTSLGQQPSHSREPPAVTENMGQPALEKPVIAPVEPQVNTEAETVSKMDVIAPSESQADELPPLPPPTQESLEDFIKRCQTFVDQADALHASRPLAAYYCRYYAAHLLGEKYKTEKAGDLVKLLGSTLDRCSSEEKVLDGTFAWRMTELESFASQIYDEASRLEGPKAASYYFLAKLLFEALEHAADGKVSAEVIEKKTLALFQGSSHLGGAVRIDAGSSVAVPPLPVVAQVPAPSPPPAPTPPPAVTPAPAPTPIATSSAYPPAQVVPPSPLPTLDTATKKRLAKEKSDAAAKRLGEGNAREGKALIIEALRILQS